MQFTQIRNATITIDFGGKKFLIDPMLSAKGAFPGFPGTVNSEQANPTVELPIPVSDIIAVDAVILTHAHPDHWDDAAKRLLPKDMPLLVQHEQDAQEVRAAGFIDVRVLQAETEFAGITLLKTAGTHGSGKVLEDFGALLGEVCGIVFRHPQEQTLYLAGDTVWNQQVADAIQTHHPNVVILNSGDARIAGYEPIIMGKDDVLAVYQAAPAAVIIASHMEAVNHATLTRTALREFAEVHGMMDRLRIPQDGESYRF